MTNSYAREHAIGRPQSMLGMPQDNTASANMEASLFHNKVRRTGRRSAVASSLAALTAARSFGLGTEQERRLRPFYEPREGTDERTSRPALDDRRRAGLR